MGSKARVRRTCRRKVSHRTRQAAERHAAHLRGAKGAGWEAYRCTLGEHWHVGRSKSLPRGHVKVKRVLE